MAVYDIQHSRQLSSWHDGNSIWIASGYPNRDSQQLRWLFLVFYINMAHPIPGFNQEFFCDGSQLQQALFQTKSATKNEVTVTFFDFPLYQLQPTTAT